MKGGIELRAKNLYGFEKETAEKLLNELAKAIKHYWRWCERRAIREGYATKGYAKEMYEREIEELREAEIQERWLKEFAEIREAIKEKRLVVRHCGGLYWATEIVKNNKIEGLSLYVMKVLCGYRLNYDKRAYCMNVYGTSRPLEIILSYGYALGLQFHEIPQDQQILY